MRIAQEHTNIIEIEKDGKILFEKQAGEEEDCDAPDYSLLTIEKIYDFADTADLEDVKAVLDRQIAYNTAIAEEACAETTAPTSAVF